MAVRGRLDVELEHVRAEGDGLLEGVIVFMGNSCSPPECAMFMTRRSSHGFGEVWQDQFFLAWPRLSVLASAAPAGPAAAVSAAASVRAPALARERTRPMAVNVLSRAAPRQTREDEM